MTVGADSTVPSSTRVSGSTWTRSIDSTTRPAASIVIDPDRGRVLKAELEPTLRRRRPTIGDLEGNVARILEAVKQAAPQAPDLIAFPELVLTGYPPRDILLDESFPPAAMAALDADPDVRVIVLAGKGKAFCAGIDLMDHAQGLGGGGS